VRASPTSFPAPQGIEAELLDAHRWHDTPEQHAARYEHYVLDAERRRVSEALAQQIKAKAERVGKVSDWSNMSGLRRALLEEPPASVPGGK